MACDGRFGAEGDGAEEGLEHAATEGEHGR